MFNSGSNEYRNQMVAIEKSLAVIRFTPEGIILDANNNFLGAMGYTLAEVKGRHHSIFVDSEYAKTDEYRDFWDSLRTGTFESREYKRYGKGGKEIWIQASYNPILDKHGRVYQVVKFATDITKQKLLSSEFQSKINAIEKSQAVIEFELDGTIIDANENFLSVTGYTLGEVKGRHHRMFVERDFANSSEYRDFWAKLGRGEFEAQEYRRFGRDSKEFWIQASYNPVFDMNGRPFKVVKYATDITEQKRKSAELSGQINAIDKSQAIIEFNLDGSIIQANENFLATLGYRLDEIKGRHHRMFVDPAYAASQDYQEFWERLRRGEFESRVYKRLHKTGREVWIQASYNPIFDMNGKLYKIIKYASDLTQLMQAAELADETNANTQSVAAAVEEMSASISEINGNMTRTLQATESIIGKTKVSTEASAQLLARVKSMGGIVELINKIAGQVNLLALNATIEAARAGEAGKGFAVVANEVKNLASQTTQATEQIAREISAMQTVSDSVAASVGDITAEAKTVEQFINSSARAIDEQTMAIREISSKTQISSSAVAEIAHRIRNLSSNS